MMPFADLDVQLNRRKLFRIKPFGKLGFLTSVIIFQWWFSSSASVKHWRQTNTKPTDEKYIFIIYKFHYICHAVSDEIVQEIKTSLTLNNQHELEK